jgi:hypothetical protein
MIKIPIPSEKLLEDLFEELLLESNGSLEDAGMDALSYDAIINRKPTEYDFLGADIYRQVGLGGYGILDVLCVYSYQILPTQPDETKANIYTVALTFELKNVPLKCIDFNQVLRYVTAIENTNMFSKVCPILIGSDVGDCHFLFNHIGEQVKGYTFSLGVNGLKFHRIGSAWQSDNAITIEDLEKQLKQKRYDRQNEPF